MTCVHEWAAWRYYLGQVQITGAAALHLEHVRGVLEALERGGGAVQLRLQGAQIIPHGGKLGVLTAKALGENAQ
jgi:hypothetical protein